MTILFVVRESTFDVGSIGTLTASAKMDLLLISYRIKTFYMYEMNNILDKGLNVKLTNENIVEFTETCAVYKDVELLNKELGKKQNMNNGVEAYKIYVNDGSGGSNIKYAESYRVYALKGEKPSFKNSYSNTYPQKLTDGEVNDMNDSKNINRNGDRDAWNLFTISQLKVKL
ncbi:hypothetical protein TVAG_172330 [Trichomonas vaginalis G3]|uniref:Uncharacterized protein n=1 Tax=Trichomonas vaginalis (strain ATCC PRA-98 / G3) TaxID=412133 RepID=A2DEY4_TRIV3|nr:hypothetical protein TVAG_172330 [Trichomonas vaginalis G3]|eukprot:XP_001581962.1 hypothetical protein [Trichomonas vaginalis G3]